VITSRAVTYVPGGFAYTYDLAGFDPDGDPISFVLGAGAPPAWSSATLRLQAAP